MDRFQDGGCQQSKSAEKSGRKEATLSTGLHKRKLIGNFHKHSSSKRYRKKPDGRQLRDKEEVRMMYVRMYVYMYE